jgi:integrase
MSAAERVKAIRPFANNEIAAILTAAETNEPDYHPLFLLLARTGMRPGEAAALQWPDINFVQRTALVERAISAGEVGTTKTEGIRTVDLSQELVDRLRALQAARPALKLKYKWTEMPEWVFCNSDGHPLDESRTRKKFAKVMKKAKVSGHRMYDLRHTWATVMLSKGVPITYVADQLGHAKPSTTLQWYARWLPQDSKAYVDSLDAVPEPILSAAAR